MMQPGEHQPPSCQTLIYGRPLAQVLPEVLERHWVAQAILVTNSSLAGPGGPAEAVMGNLAGKGETLITGIREGTPRADVMRIAGSLRGRGTEALVALGGGSVVEAAKAARICLTNNVGTAADMDRLRTVTTAASPRPCLISIPTTLSGAEYTPFARVLDEASGQWDVFSHKDLAPDVVLLDPAMTLATPALLWLSGGIGALGQAIEAWCYPLCTPYADASALYAARLLMEGLTASHRAPDDLDARLRCQIGARFAIQGGATGIPFGASQIIGRAVTAVAGVKHGLTSCILLPHMLHFDAAINGARQAELASVLPGHGALADRVAALVAKLGLPNRLRDAGVAEAAVPAIAAQAIADDRLSAIARPLATIVAVEELLRAAW